MRTRLSGIVTALLLAAATLVLLWSGVVFAATAPQRQGAAGVTYGYTGASTMDDLVAFELATGTAISPGINLLPEGNYPYDATFSRDASQVWVAGASGEGVVVVDANANTIIERIPAVGGYPVDVVFSEHGEYAFVSNREEADDIAIVDTSTYTIVNRIDVPDYYLGPGKMRVNHCTGDLYAVNWYDDRFFVIDTESMSVVVDIQLGDSLWDLTLDATASTLYIADRGTDEVHVVDAATQALITSIPVGDDPWGIDITPDGAHVLVANEDSSTVSVINTAGNFVTTTITLPADSDPRDVDVTLDGDFAYVPSGDLDGPGPDAVYVIDLSDFSLRDPVVMPDGYGANPNVVAVAPDFASLDPIAGFTSDSPVPLGTPVQFTDTSDNNPTSWDWDFGDGVGSSTEQNPEYTYSNPGTYTVTLTVENACGSSSYQDMVEVNAPELSIGKTGPAAALVGELITYTLTVTNSGDVTATGLVVTDVLPVGASYVGGGTLIGDVVNWTLSSLAPNSSATFQFWVTAQQTIVNSEYGVTADGGLSAVGTTPVVTVLHKQFLPVMLRQ